MNIFLTQTMFHIAFQWPCNIQFHPSFRQTKDTSLYPLNINTKANEHHMKLAQKNLPKPLRPSHLRHQSQSAFRANKKVLKSIPGVVLLHSRNAVDDLARGKHGFYSQNWALQVAVTKQSNASCRIRAFLRPIFLYQNCLYSQNTCRLCPAIIKMSPLMNMMQTHYYY